MFCSCPKCGCGFDQTSAALPPPKHTDRILHLLDTNDPPDNDEIIHLRSSIHQLSLDEAVLKKEINRLNAVVSELSKRRTQGQKLRKDYAKILNPNKRLPIKTLQEIFLACINRNIVRDIATGILPDTTTSLDASQAPWTLAQVSRRWRCVSLSYPRLWSYIAAPFVRNRFARDAGSISVAISTQLQLSCSYPLSISITITGVPEHGRFQRQILRLCPSLVLLLSCSHRWREVHFGINAVDCYGFSVLRGSLMNLHTVYFTGPLDDSPPEMMFLDTPALKSVWSAGSLRTPLHPTVQIKEIHILPSNSTHTAYYKALPTACPHLDKLSYHSSMTVRSEQQHPRIFQSLRSLSLVAPQDEGRGCEWLTWLTIPILQSLEITGQIDLPIILEFLGASDCHLLKLCLYALFAIPTCTDLLTIFPRLIQLQKLHLSGFTDIQVELISSLNESNDDGTRKWLPSLTNISFEGAMGVTSEDLVTLHINRPMLMILVEGRTIS